MDRKIDQLLFALMQNMTIAVSGEKLARDLGVSHSALVRWIEKLRQARVEIRGDDCEIDCGKIRKKAKERIDEYCRQRSLNIKARLQLLLQVQALWARELQRAVTDSLAASAEGKR